MADEFITGDQLTAQVGLTAGTAFNSDAGWLKFALNNRTLYVAKRPFRRSLNWNALITRQLVLGDRQVIINKHTYTIRLLKGRGDNLTTAPGNGYDLPSTYDSEWNRLMYHVSASPNAGATTSEGISVGDWAQFSNAELGLDGTYGYRSWCQEVNGSLAIVRGTQNNLSYIFTGGIATTSNTLIYGWRPVLELVE